VTGADQILNGLNHGPFGEKNFFITNGHWPYGPSRGDVAPPGADPLPRSAGTCQGWPMRWIDRLNMAQRVVVVITLGLALGIVASYLTGLGVRNGW